MEKITNIIVKLCKKAKKLQNFLYLTVKMGTEIRNKTYGVNSVQPKYCKIGPTKFGLKKHENIHLRR